MIRAQYGFPTAFLWGTATSSHQVEGGNTSNDWHAWEQEPNRILHGHVSGEACGWWRGLWQEDFDRAAKTHQNAHRLSIEWSRVEPSQALWDDHALDHYRQMILGAIDRGLTPIVTLNHFTLPIWFSEQGGWLSESSPRWFERYVRRVVGALKDAGKDLGDDQRAKRTRLRRVPESRVPTRFEGSACSPGGAYEYCQGACGCIPRHP